MKLSDIEKSVSLSISMPIEMISKIEDYANKRRFSRSKAIRYLINKGMNDK